MKEIGTERGKGTTYQYHPEHDRYGEIGRLYRHN
jgi:hypothetical protein